MNNGRTAHPTRLPQTTLPPDLPPSFSPDLFPLDPTAEQDQLTRRRDEKDNRLPHAYASSVPLNPDEPLEQSPYVTTLDVIGQSLLGRSAALAGEYGKVRDRRHQVQKLL